VEVVVGFFTYYRRDAFAAKVAFEPLVMVVGSESAVVA